ncbi:sugar phosphate isomerase/epimerase family protein [Autumnicola edwardsiae]|uniref:Sugar phosphate isomerase/epimerase n=1 Tax=Autumnicola edwardsiae TaxID=3075594 RepID=A0ABU3CW90_9FLAO|nr:sugar phosphate isomerase/epimerase [Zunongwangia sp. F297]MDT0650630.1 sugar phosphate isomerase/epimerase [Zunongwangia sp. F297]
MEIKYFCPRWGSTHLSFDRFLRKVRDAGYDGVEMSFSSEMDQVEKSEMLDGLTHYDLELIGQQWRTTDRNFNTHLYSFEKHLFKLCEGKPLFINSHTGKDYYTQSQNMTLINRAREISKEMGVKIIHETHRGRWSFAAHTTKEYLIKFSEIRLTLDISHWCNVAESLLEDQEEAVAKAIYHTDHIHARVGFQEGPQINDPQAPEWKKVLDTHLCWWDRVIALHRQKGSDFLTITPEFGAPPYLPLLPFTKQPIVDQWDTNIFMMNLLTERWK